MISAPKEKRILLERKALNKRLEKINKENITGNAHAHRYLNLLRPRKFNIPS
jgi:hypothetical protein